MVGTVSGAGRTLHESGSPCNCARPLRNPLSAETFYTLRWCRSLARAGDESRMTFPPNRLLRGLFAPALAAAAALLACPPAAAQATLSADAGLQRFYKAQRWMPVQVTLTNQGAPVKVAVRARFATGQEGGQEYRLAERDLQSGANQLHTLYMKAPMAYGTQNVALELYRDGRLVNTVNPPVSMVNPGDLLVVGIGPQVTSLVQLTARPANIPPRSLPLNTRRFVSGGGGQVQIHVAILDDPAKTPDRWQGLEAADMVVVNGSSERDFTPERLTALRDYANAGGLVVVTGGIDWQRLTTPFFKELLPVDVTGARTTTALPGLSQFTGSAPSGAGFGVCTATLKPGSRSVASEGGSPLIAEGPKGSGKVVFIAFDPSRPPFTGWDGLPGLWQRVLMRQQQGRILEAVQFGDWVDNPYGGYSGQARLASAPYAISQLDIPAFYIVALFLLAYIVVLVPVNYYFLKARDKKEYAWLTTPAIVALFSVGAYMIGYGFKGGSTLVVKIGVIEARAGQDSAPHLTYAGLFSPRKTTYDVEFASEGTTPTDAASGLLSEAPSGGQSAGLRIVQGDGQRVDDFGVDMWAMRVLKADGMTRLGRGFTSTLQRRGQGLSGQVRNDTPFTVEDCRLIVGNSIVPLGTAEPGKSLTVDSPNLAPAAAGTLLPTGLQDQVQGSKEEQRIRRAILQPLCTSSVAGQAGWNAPRHPLLVGWVKEPVTKLQVNGHPPREQTATLMIVHLN